MASINNIDKLRAKLAALEKEHPRQVSVIVGYTQSYAVFVHEDLNAHHKEGKSAKFLEGPARDFRKELARLIAQGTAKTGKLEVGLKLAGLRLQRESMKIVPIEFGFLRGSAFTMVES